jgi:hypothetical protein
VRISYDFEMGTTEVTVGQFRAFIKATGYPTDGEKVGVSWSRGPDTDWQSEDAVPWCRAVRDQSDDHPAIFISWYDAMAFCHWLSRETGQEIRLPSEAEWEHACGRERRVLRGRAERDGLVQLQRCNHLSGRAEAAHLGLTTCTATSGWSISSSSITKAGRRCPPEVQRVGRGSRRSFPTPGWLAAAYTLLIAATAQRLSPRPF